MENKKEPEAKKMSDGELRELRLTMKNSKKIKDFRPHRIEDDKDPQVYFWKKITPIFKTRWAELSNDEKLGYRRFPEKLDTTKPVIILIHGQFSSSISMELTMKEL